MKNYAVMPLTDYANICDKVREKTATTENIKAGDMPDKINDVYEAGKKAEYDNFWDIVQNYGTRADYTNYFSAYFWNNEIFKPKYSMAPVYCDYMFYNSQLEGDFLKIFEDLGITFTTKNFKNSQVQVFRSMKKITSLPPMEFECISFNYWFTDNIALKSIVFKNSGFSLKPSWTQTFSNCTALENVTFEGTIWKSIDFSYSPLTVESAKNICEHLNDFVALYQGDYSQCFTERIVFNDDTWARLDATYTPPLGSDWRACVQMKGWNY